MGGHTLLGPPYGGVAVGDYRCVRYGVAEILTDKALFLRDVTEQQLQHNPSFRYLVPPSSFVGLRNCRDCSVRSS
jgi:hypothetical protein